MLSITTRLVGLLGSPMLFLVDRSITDFLQHILAFNQFAKGRVLMIEPVHGCEADEELRTGRIRIGPRAIEITPRSWAMIVKLGLDLVSGTALSVAVLFRRIFRVRVAALDHESFDDAVENGPS